MENGPTQSLQHKVEYRNPEIAGLESDAVLLVEKLKEKIDANFYNLLVSDETGGRLPTLLIKAIIKKRHPNTRVDILFLNGGKMLRQLIDDRKPEEEQSFVDYIKFTTKENQTALVVTQVMRSGESLAIMASMLKQSGCKHVDVATIRSGFKDKPIYQKDIDKLRDSEIFIGRKYAYTDEFDDKNNVLSGVTKVKNFVVHPHTTASLLKGDNDESRVELQKTINGAREDINKMAESIYKKVWQE